MYRETVWSSTEQKVIRNSQNLYLIISKKSWFWVFFAIHAKNAQEERSAQSGSALRKMSLRGCWLLLKRPGNLSEKQTTRMSELLKLNLASIKGYLLREDFQRFWEYKRPDFAEKFLDNRVTRALRTDLKPMKKVARMLRIHKSLILNWLKAKGRLSSGAVEGMNLKAKLTMRKAYGFKTLASLEIALYHTLGELPVPEYHHRFC